MVYSIACGLPFCQKTQDEETTLSKGIRLSAIVLGSMLATASLISVFLITGSNTVLWASFSIGVAMALVGAAVKCVKNHIEATIGVSEKSTPPKEIVAKLPVCLKLYLQKLPYLRLKGNSVTFKELKKLVQEPITLFSAGSNIGICMKLQVRHIKEDKSYDRSDVDLELSNQNSLPSSEKPFFIYVVALKKNLAGERWDITSEDRQYITHRNGPFATSAILGDALFYCLDSDWLDEDTVAKLVDTEKQDDVIDECEFHLAWLLPRLIEKGQVQVREFKTHSLFRNCKDQVIGYWELSTAPESGNEEH